MIFRSLLVPSVCLSALMLDAGAAHGQITAAPRTTRMWGFNNYGQGTIPQGLGALAAIDCGGEFTVALTAEGSVRTWGRNDYGQLGVPAGLPPVRSVSAGYAHCVIATLSGQVVCWGYNFSGQCNVPTGLPSIVAVEAGVEFSMAVSMSGSVHYWGLAAGSGALVPPAGLPAVTQISASQASSDSHALALTTTGTVVSWGSNTSGQRNIPSLPTVVAVAAGRQFSAALTASGQVVCWGSNSSGQCSVPVGLGPVTSISAGSGHMVAVLASGAVRCWGSNLSHESTVPSALGIARIAAAGDGRSAVIFDVAALNARSNAYFDRLSDAASDAAQGDTILVDPAAIDSETVDYVGKALDIRSAVGIARLAGSTTLFSNGARLTAAESVLLNGNLSVSANSTATISGGTGVQFGGNAIISGGASLLANSGGSETLVTGTLSLGNGSAWAAFGPAAMASGSTVQSTGGTIVADGLSIADGANLVSVGGMVGVDSLQVAGDASLLDSTVIGQASVAAQGDVYCSGELIGGLTNAGRVVTADDMLVSGAVTNQSSGTLIAQLGTLYIAGGLVNNGQVYGSVVVPPAFNGGGSSGTQPGDGITIAGPLAVGPTSSFRFAEDVWNISICGDVSIACSSSGFALDGATLRLDGCGEGVQALEVTSADLGCVAAPFSGEETGVSLIGRLEIAPGATVSLVDEFDNARGKPPEVVYARELSIGSGATLLTNGIKVFTRSASIAGKVDDPTRLCILPDLPNPDINGDGNVNAIDLSFILTYWGTSTAIADLDRSGVVGAPDLSIVLGGWTG